VLYIELTTKGSYSLCYVFVLYHIVDYSSYTRPSSSASKSSKQVEEYVHKAIKSLTGSDVPEAEKRLRKALSGLYQ